LRSRAQAAPCCLPAPCWPLTILQPVGPRWETGRGQLPTARANEGDQQLPLPQGLLLLLCLLEAKSFPGLKANALSSGHCPPQGSPGSRAHRNSSFCLHTCKKSVTAAGSLATCSCAYLVALGWGTYRGYFKLLMKTIIFYPKVVCYPSHETWSRSGHTPSFAGQIMPSGCLS
jgi:hypothetical protein